MNIPGDLIYTKDHEWMKITDDTGTIGVTDFAQGELGDVVFIEVETVDEELDKDEAFGTIEAVKTVSDMFMPVSGTVIEFNEALDTNPELVNQDPYGDGWIVKLRINDAEELKDLLTAEQYKEIIEG